MCPPLRFLKIVRGAVYKIVKFVFAGPVRVFSVGVPVFRVVHDVLADAVKFIVVANDPFEIVSLPEMFAMPFKCFICGCGRN